MKGEFVGRNGKRYRWVKEPMGGVDTELWSNESQCWVSAYLHPSDRAVAFAALDELLEEEEWVEWEARNDLQYDEEPERYRIRRDGAGPQFYQEEWSSWVGHREDLPWVCAYRKGLEIGREDARELAEAVLGAMVWQDFATGIPEYLPTADAWRRIRSLAEKVRGES